MNSATHPAAKAIWFIENHFGQPLTLDEIADAAAVSRFHLARVFEARMGQPVMSYVRGRRLTEAARRLAKGVDDILSVALDAQYGSHEAFTRAFRDRFGVTPEAARLGQADIQPRFQEPILMDVKIIETASPHSLKKGRAMTLGGLKKRYAMTGSAAIPAQWQTFVPYLGNIPAQTGPVRTAYGVCYNSDEDGNFDYLCAVEVQPGADLPAGFVTLELAARTYAVFPHAGHISGIRSTWATIWDRWLPESGLKAEDAPFFELYGPSFDENGNGGLEIWIPVKT